MAEDINQSGSNMSSESDPDYGLPEVTLTPIERGGIGRRKGTVKTGNRNATSQEKKSNAPLIVSLLFVFLLVLAALWYFFGQDFFSSDPVSQRANSVENTTPEDQESIPPDTGLDTDPNDDLSDSNLEESNEDVTGRGVDSFGGDESNDGAADGIGEAGVFNIVNQRTGRTYVIIGSFFDEDLARDYAVQLGKQGISTTLIMPAENKKFYRLSIADFGTISEAINNLDDFRADYGSSLWIIKY